MSVDWLASMTRTYEFYIVDPVTWGDKKRIDTVTACSIRYDDSVETLATASFTLTEEIGEVYVRVYMVVIQNGVKMRIPLGTFLTTSPNVSFDGKVKSVSIESYSPLLELKEKYTPIGYTAPKNQEILPLLATLCEENMRSPVLKPSFKSDKFQDDFIAGGDETWLSFITAALKAANYKFEFDENFRVMFAPIQDVRSLQPKWIYNDDNSSILQPQITISRDLYGIPNVVEVVYSRSGNSKSVMRSVVKNDDPSNPLSVQARGREIVYRETSPNIIGIPTQEYLDDYAEKLLRKKSSLECSLSYTHGYCPVRVGDAVLLNYNRLGLLNVKAKVTSQTLTCDSGAQVSETAVFTTELWNPFTSK